MLCALLFGECSSPVQNPEGKPIGESQKDRAAIRIQTEQLVPRRSSPCGSYLDTIGILSLIAIHEATGIDIPEADYMATLTGCVVYLRPCIAWRSAVKAPGLNLLPDPHVNKFHP
jgi:hypothetical protein